MENCICVNDVSVVFKMEVNRVTSIKEYLIKFFKDQLIYEEFQALSNITFTVPRGTVVGILGRNGAGKSTLLKIIAGVLEPTQGNVELKGTIAPLIELGAGFDYELTGFENIYLGSAMLGLKKSEIDLIVDDVIQFSELGDFINSTIKSYSSGMLARLAFSIATAVNPDILIVDEVLSVGDSRFQEKCMNRIKDIERSGATILFVSHSINQVKALCRQAILLEKGRLLAQGTVEDVATMYEEILGMHTQV